MIRIYKNDCEDFNNNGLGILTDFKTSPKIKESLNSSFELNFDYALKGKNAEFLIVDYIIKVPYDNSEQLFRIKKVTPTLTKISIYAVHIFYDLSENFLTDVAPTKKSGVNAINWILENTMFPTKFSVTGDLISDNSARYVRKNPVDAILGADNCIVKRWGGEIERDNYNIILHKQRGSDKGVYIKQGKNIKEIEISVDFTSVVTRVVPQGANELLLPEYQIDSPLLETYRNPIVAKYEFSDISVDEETTKEQAYDKLREAAEALFSKEGIDKPKIYVKVNWLELSKTEEYRYQYGSFESVRLGDTVVVQALGYEYKIRVITIEYDCLLNRYTSFEIGDPKANYVERQLSIVTSEIQKNSSSLLEKAKKAATTLINNGFGGHVRIYPDRILIMDTKNEATAKNVWQWNLNGFAHSSNGINGDYDTAITIDGQIVADRITTGTMDVQRINGLANELGKINTSLELNESNITACVNDLNETKNKIKLTDSKEDNFPVTIKKCASKSPIELKIYGNSYQDVTNGYQLFDESKLDSRESTSGVTLINNGDGSYTIEGNDTLSSNFNYGYNYSHEETLKLLKPGNITISDNGIVGQTTVPYYLAQLRNSSGTIFEISSRVTNSYSKTITQEMLNDETTFLRIGFYGAKDTSLTKKTIKPMLYQNGDGTFERFTGGMSSPNPDYSQEIKTLKGTKNLFNGILKLGSINNNTGDYESSNNCIIGEQYINVNPNKKYSISTLKNYSVFVHFYDVNKNYISYDNTQKTPKIITTPENCYYIRIRTRQAENITDLNSKIQVEEGNMNHEYVPYGHWLRLNQRGKNYLDSAKASLKSSDGMTFSRSEQTLHIAGTSTALINFWLLNLNEKLEAGTYSFSSNLSLEGKGRYVIRDSNNVVLLNNTYSNKFTIKEDTVLQSVLIQINANVTLDSKINLQLEKNNISTEYEPYKEENYYINMNKENLFNVQEYVEKNSDYYTIDENDDVTCIKTDSRSSGFEYYLNLPIGTYTFSTTNNCNLRIYESDDSSFPSQQVSFQRNDKNRIVFTTTKPYITFKTFSTSLPSLIGQVKLFAGTNEDTFYELVSLDNIKDEVIISEEGNAKLIKKSDKYVFDEERNYQLSNLPDDFECTRFRTRQVLPNNYLENYAGLCDKFVTRLPNSPSTDSEYVLFANGYVYFSIKKSRLEENTENSFKKWIQNNPVTVYYKLEKEQIIDLGRIEQKKLFKGTNIVSLNSNLRTKLFIKYYLDNEFNENFSTLQETSAMIKIAGNEIENKVSSTYVTSDTLNNNYYSKTNVEDMILNSETGVTNTFSEAGGNNVFRNTGLWFRDNEEDTFEFWTGKAKKTTNDNATLRSSILLQSGKFRQEQDVPNGSYSVSFFYTKLNPLANSMVSINDKTYPLYSTDTKQFFTGEQDEDGNYIVLPIEVNSGHLSIEFSTNIDNSTEVYDLMVNKGSVKLAYSQNQNETTTDTVNISKGITMTSSVDDSMFKANSDGIRILNKNSGEKITDFTDKGMTTKQAKIEEEADICKVLFRDIGEQTWLTRL